MSMKVLIADGDWRFSRQVCSYLETHAHLVVSETDPKRAVERAAHWQADLVILAAELADNTLMNALYALRPRPAVLLTGWVDRYDLAWRAWQIGGDELLMKPVFYREDLHRAIVSAMEGAAIGVRAGSAVAASASA